MLEENFLKQVLKLWSAAQLKKQGSQTKPYRNTLWKDKLKKKTIENNPYLITLRKIQNFSGIVASSFLLIFCLFFCLGFLIRGNL